MAQTSTYTMMRRLQQHEELIADRIAELDITQGNTRLARAVYCLTDNGSPDPSIRSWGTWAQPLNILQMLLLQPTVSADVYPIDRETFNQLYGVTPEQFIDLAKDGFVIPNLIADSDLKNQEADSQYAKHQHLANIFDWTVTRCHINGIRRGKLFEALRYGRERQETNSLMFREFLAPLLSEWPPQELQKSIVGTFRSSAEVPIMLGNNMMYIDVFGSDDDKRILYEFSQKTLDWPLEKLVAWIQGKSIYLSGPITAAYGGVHNLPQRYCEAIIRAGIIGARGEDERTVDEPTSAFAEFLQAVSEVRSRGLSLSEAEPPKFPMGERSFSNFVSFLKEKRNDLEHADQLLMAFRRVASTHEEYSALQNCLDYVGIYTALAEDAYKSNHTRDIVGSVFLAGIAGGAVAGAAKKTVELAVGKYVDIHFPNRRVLLGLVGAGIGGAVAAPIAGLAALGVHVVENLSRAEGTEGSHRFIIDRVTSLLK